MWEALKSFSMNLKGIAMALSADAKAASATAAAPAGRPLDAAGVAAAAAAAVDDDGSDSDEAVENADEGEGLPAIPASKDPVAKAFSGLAVRFAEKFKEYESRAGHH